MSRQRRSGFTLIELVIALAIVAAMLAIMFSGLRVGLAAWRQGDARADALQHGRSLNLLLTRALSGAHPYRAGAIGREASIVLFDGDRDHLAFVTATPPVPGPVPIAFTAVTCSRGESGLVIRQKPLPNHEPFAEIPPAVVDDSVAALQFRYRRGAGGTWEDRWDSQVEKTLPDAVEITLTTRQGHQRTEQPPVIIALRVTTP